jgi:hypothetical protein
MSSDERQEVNNVTPYTFQTWDLAATIKRTA